ncbi:MAG TPA: TIGR03435 family protein [Candidatus Baltobacteraceae bacterium]|jgi:uncharacterized protein (TIGR03435 family)|nr:TIGR03435 family protein [Candidatus Baltobacteraceae bacterium]
MRCFIAVVAISCAIAYESFATADINGPKQGDMPPPLVVTQTIQGPVPKEISWEKLKGKVVVLEFWATWCGPCVAAIPHLNDLVEQFHDKPVVFLSVSSEEAGFVRNFLKLRPMKGWVALDDDEGLKNAFHVQGIPHTVIVDAGGRIAAITHPAKLEARHLEEVLNGQKCSLPDSPVFNSRSTVADVVPTEPPPLFEITISRRKVPKNSNGPMCSWSGKNDGSAFHGEEATVESALENVFGWSRFRMSIKGQLPEGYYNFQLQASPGHKVDLQNQFLAALRTTFGLEVAKTIRESEVYQLTQINTNAPGLIPTEKEGGGGLTRGEFLLTGSDMKVIVAYLELLLEKPVVDETKLSGRFLVGMQWEMADGETKPKADVVIEAARTRLGLKLTPVRKPIEIIEIHRMSATDSE